MIPTWQFAEYNLSETRYTKILPTKMSLSDMDLTLIKTPCLMGNITFPAAGDLFAPFISKLNPNYPWAVTSDDAGLSGMRIALNSTITDSTPVLSALTPQVFNASQEGILHLRYDVIVSVGTTAAAGFAFAVEAEIFISSNLEPLPRWNAKTMIERLLLRAETLRKSESPRFHLNATQAAEFEKIEMPEMHFSNSTLREALQTIGAFIHGEPRLKGNEILFDMYGSNEKTDVDFSVYAAKSFQQSIDNAVTSIDSTVDNLVSTTGYAKGVTVEPYAGGFKTVRTETLYERINEDNMLISVQFGINRIIKLECGFVGDQVSADNLPLDITPYVFEESDYVRMSAYTSTYPNSRAYAIYYSQGGTTIQGLNFKQADAVSPVFKDCAIVNIIRAVSGNTNLSVSDYPLLAFRVTYESITSARVKQNKQYILGAPEQTEIAYNQGQNLIESGYFGENLKGVVARLGNVDKVITLYQRGTPKIPKVGTLYDDDYYISSVAVELLPYVTKISCALSKDFNRYSDYISVNSTRRFYEISERQAYDSYINYRDYVVIGDSFTGASTPTPLVGMSEIVKTFNPTPTSEIIQVEVPSEVKIVLDDGTEAAVGSQTATKLVVRATGVSSSEQVYLQLSYTYENIISGRSLTGGFNGTTTLPYTVDLSSVGANMQFTTDSTATATVVKSEYKDGIKPPVTFTLAQGFAADYTATDYTSSTTATTKYIAPVMTVTFSGTATEPVDIKFTYSYTILGETKSKIYQLKDKKLPCTVGLGSSLIVPTNQAVTIHSVMAVSGSLGVGTVALPVKAMPLGNSAVFTFKYKDNYSAGDQAVYQSSGDVTGYFQNGVAYKDYYGNMEYLAFDFFGTGRTPDTADDQKEIGLALPAADTVYGTGDTLISTGLANPLHVSVGNTEIPTITYQIDFVTNRKDIIVGSALAKNLPLVSGEQNDKVAKLYVLPKRVNKFSQTVDLTGATLINANIATAITVFGDSVFMRYYNALFTAQTSTVSGEAWAIVDEGGGLLIAENKAITGDGTTDILGGLTLTLTHNIYKR